jgi:hypothetical protein
MSGNHVLALESDSTLYDKQVDCRRMVEPTNGIAAAKLSGTNPWPSPRAGP